MRQSEGAQGCITRGERIVSGGQKYCLERAPGSPARSRCRCCCPTPIPTVHLGEVAASVDGGGPMCGGSLLSILGVLQSDDRAALIPHFFRHGISPCRLGVLVTQVPKRCSLVVSGPSMGAEDWRHSSVALPVRRALFLRSQCFPDPGHRRARGFLHSPLCPLALTAPTSPPRAGP